MSAPLDKAGHEIKLGDFIVYGHALGRCAGLRFGRVVAINAKGDKHHFTVRSIDDDWSGKIAKLNDRKGTLQFEERILVISPDILPDYYRTLLSDLPELAGKVCQDCGLPKADTKDTTCPFAYEINSNTVNIRVCDACYHERALEI